MVIEYREKKQYVEENIHLLGSSQDIPQQTALKSETNFTNFTTPTNWC